MDLKKTILDVVSRQPSTEGINDFVLLCRKIAVVQLRRKAATGRLDTGLFGLGLEDLAMDCIGDLFQRNDHGYLIQVKAYFESLPPENSSDQEILANLRRMVFSRVNRGLFRFYHDVDPELSRIIRNIKLAVQALGTYEMTERFGETVLITVPGDSLAHLPPLDLNELQARLGEVAGDADTIPLLLSRLAKFLRHQDEYCRIVPLIPLSMAIRSYFRSLGAGPAEASIPDQFTIPETISLIRDTCARVRSAMHNSYVTRKKLSEDLFSRYFRVVEENLIRTIIHSDGESMPLFDLMKSVQPGLTKQEYRSNHKSIVEYLNRLVYDKVADEIRKQSKD